MLRFPFTEDMDLDDLADFRDRMGSSKNPLYTWGNLAGYDDQEIDGFLGRTGKSSLKDRPGLLDLSPQEVLDYFLKIGVHPAFVLPMRELYYPAPVLQALIMVAESDAFSPETRNEALHALNDIFNHHKQWTQHEVYCHHVECNWETFRVGDAHLSASVDVGALSDLFGGVTAVKVDYDPVMLTERKFSAYEEMLRLELEEVSGLVGAFKAEKKKQNRIINDTRRAVFGEGDGDLAGGYEEAEAYIFNLMKTAEFSNLERTEKWKRIADMLVQPGSALNKFVRPDIGHITRSVGDGRFLGWPELGREFTRAYCRFHAVSEDLTGEEKKVTGLKARLDYFLKFWDRISANGEMSIYDARHFIDAVDLAAVNASIENTVAPKLEKDPPD